MDRIDSEIVGLLQKNGRLSNKEIAAEVGLAPSSCWERVQRLVAAGVFAGFHAEVDPRAMGVGLQAMVAVRLARHRRDRLDKFRREILRLPEVVGLYHLAGRDDFLVHVAMRDADQLREFLLARFTTRAEVTHLETHLIFDHVKNPVMPRYEPR
ncbi:MAG: Lrp/AsnC family transcriptional regulator [Gemmatimonadales bacterium]